MSINFIGFSQTVENKPKNNTYYNEKIRLNTKEKECIDTIFTFRNYIDDNDEKRIACNDLVIDKDIEKLIWECKYIAVYLKYQNDMNKFSIISYRTNNKNSTIVCYFLCDRKSRKTVEMVRFKVENKEIVGINILPCCYDGFVPIDEFDNPKFDY
jgi:hypothetical protein